jgi:predicted DNA-binding transcriptional regulator YafY
MNSNIGWPVPGFLKDIYQDIRNQEMNQIQETIETAIRNGTSVWIDYTDELGAKSSGREFKAEAVIVQKDGTYLNGRDPTAGYRSFRLDRVSKVYTSKPVEEWNEGDIIERTDGHKFVDPVRVRL